MTPDVPVPKISKSENPKAGPLRSFPSKVFARLQFFQGFLIVAALLTSAFAARHYFKAFFVRQVQDQLRDTLKLTVARENWDKKDYEKWCAERAHGTDIRFTIIDRNGWVLCDSELNPIGMDNHLDREEVQVALTKGEGYSLRRSETNGQELIYGAHLLPEGRGMLRAALSLVTLQDALRAYDVTLGVILLGLAMLLFFFAYWSSQQMMEPVFGEWTELERSIDKIGRDLARTSESLSLEREELATLMAGISDGVLAVDTDGLPLFFNSRFALLMKALGLRQERPHYSETFALSPPLMQAFDRALTDGLSSSLEAIPFFVEGRKRYFSVSVSPLRRRTQTVYGAVGLFHEVTELKLAEQIRIDFVANVSHELRTPLTSIQGYTETLLDDIKENRPIESKFLVIIERNTGRLLDLIDDLLDISALESTSEALKKSTIDTAAISNRVLIQLAQKLDTRGQKVKVENSVPTLEADARRVEQILINLLDNAIKFSPEDGEISLRWEHSKDKSHILLKVTDVGPGIALEHQARLFERFYRVDKARSREMGGTGLGLSIVKHIMLVHRGSVSVVSAPGRGATFICSFPNDSSATT